MSDRTILLTQRDIAYLPLPNRVDVVLDGSLAPEDLTPTAFAMTFLDDGRLVMAVNRRRGREIPGGHKDDGETAEQAAARELFEETGCRVEMLVPLGHHRNMCEGEIPDGYRYPFPLSFQQFMVGIVTEVADYAENDECLMPAFLTRQDALATLRPAQLCFYNAAYEAVFGADRRNWDDVSPCL